MLTEEQKRKIEEKKTKALEKLKQKNKSQSFTSPVKNPSLPIAANVGPSFRKRPISNPIQEEQSEEYIVPKNMNKTSFSPKFKKQKQDNQSEECIVPKNMNKTSFSPKFKKQKQDNQEEYDPSKNYQTSPSKTLPKTSYSPKFKSSTCQPTFKRSIVKSFDQSSNSHKEEAKQQIEDNRLRALIKLKNKQNNSNYCKTKKSENSMHPTPPSAMGLSITNSVIKSSSRDKISLSTSYSPTFKKKVFAGTNKEDVNKEEPSKESSSLPICSNQQRGSFSPLFKMKSAAEDFFANESSTSMQRIPATSFSPKFRKKPSTTISTTESDNNSAIPINSNFTNSVFIFNGENSATDDLLSNEFIDVINSKQRAEENRKKALEKLKNKQTTEKSSLQSELQKSSQETESMF